MSQANYHNDRNNAFPSFYSHPLYKESVKVMPGHTSIADLHRNAPQNILQTKAKLPSETARNYVGYKVARQPNTIDISKDPRGGPTGTLTSGRKVAPSPGPKVKPQTFVYTM